jgi:predicted RNA-binding protein YlxR (DUF448 family)
MATDRYRRVPTRSCVACRTSRAKRELVRIVRRPDRSVMIDDTGRVAGRGAYVCRDDACMTKAIDRGALARALETTIPADLLETLIAGMTHRLEGGDQSGKE